jgi:hypothetical protein
VGTLDHGQVLGDFEHDQELHWVSGLNTARIATPALLDLFGFWFGLDDGTKPL